MKLCLSIVSCLLLAVGCKTDKPEQTAAAAQDNAATAPATPKGRSGKIDFQHRPIRRDQPALPSDGSDSGSGDDRWAARRERMEERRKERMSEIDTDGDGKLSPEELAAARTKRAEEMHGRFDANGDGKLTPDELGEARMFRRNGTPADLDTDKNGDISNAELEAGMEKMRQGFRRNWEDRAGRPDGTGSAQPPQ